ncbi:UNKNOWN [Stylonychia lemnae]|uniref:TLDc domain-containing protein n=1 Tax=Stylonychia lemnae TaxID=5949 RepID=A0A077ZWP6_STYLE|nr:UNKNOWN [Stylonychia lemnae]|eukprot:CDW73712.1 UNKNOWN [Stylonychia lemnae]
MNSSIASIITCDMCNIFFNELDRKPLIVSCGDTICKKCYEMERSEAVGKTMKCPFQHEYSIDDPFFVNQKVIRSLKDYDFHNIKCDQHPHESANIYSKSVDKIQCVACCQADPEKIDLNDNAMTFTLSREQLDIIFKRMVDILGIEIFRIQSIVDQYQAYINKEKIFTGNQLLDLIRCNLAVLKYAEINSEDEMIINDPLISGFVFAFTKASAQQLQVKPIEKQQKIDPPKQEIKVKDTRAQPKKQLIDQEEKKSILQNLQKPEQILPQRLQSKKKESPISLNSKPLDNIIVQDLHQQKPPVQKKPSFEIEYSDKSESQLIQQSQPNFHSQVQVALNNVVNKLPKFYWPMQQSTTILEPIKKVQPLVEQKEDQLVFNWPEQENGESSQFYSKEDLMSKDFAEEIPQQIKFSDQRKYKEFRRLIMKEIQPDYQSKIRKEIKKDCKSKFQLLYKAAFDGFTSKNFHNLCDKKGATLTFILADSGQIFGAYTSVAWTSPAKWQWKKDTKAFIFQLKKGTIHKPTKFTDCAVRHQKDYLMVFGKGCDLIIKNDCNVNRDSFSDLGETYLPPEGYQSKEETTKCYLAGSYQFKVIDIEVYKVSS